MAKKAERNINKFSLWAKSEPGFLFLLILLLPCMILDCEAFSAGYMEVVWFFPCVLEPEFRGADHPRVRIIHGCGYIAGIKYI